jgi:hypothetical protein
VLIIIIMQSSLGPRIVLENGPVSNVLPGLELINQGRVANICKRSYYFTVP